MSLPELTKPEATKGGGDHHDSDLLSPNVGADEAPVAHFLIL